MKYLQFLLIICFISTSCQEPRKLSSTDPELWEARMVKDSMPDSLETGSTFLSVYSQIYVRNSETLSDLAATVSIHNPNLENEIYIEKAVFYNTHGEPIRSYFHQPIFIKSMETVQIIIDGIDNEGGTGANFIFDWRTSASPPIFEAVMLTTYGQQGISFVTEGKRIDKY
ncbi:DUF3124 domain-containing protein [Winogradskyella ursingii]|uniref:DUF3124 domain-containing protein n=1 Tax=Winogradskyella ursingii TaxID=2686079 RepID=UPI0015C737AC|nr:DUF3124 domain-containing protein [Winogradskyella ursingii]